MARDSETIRLGTMGLVATFVGIGMGRFSFTPLIPLIVAEGQGTSPEAAVAAASMMVGYTIGAFSAAGLSRRFGLARVLHWAFLVTIVALGCSILPIGVIGHGVVRTITGVTGGLLMVLGPAAVLRVAGPDRRAGVAALTYSGIGLGILVSGGAVPLLADAGTGAIALALTAMTVVAAAIGWRGWPANAPTAEEPSPGDGRFPSVPVLLLGAAYALDACGYIPHTAFWSDFIAGELGHGAESGGRYWMIFGVGALCGPVLAARLARAVGFRHGVTLALGFKALMVALPLISVAPVALVVSSFAVGALTPGLVALVSGRLAELASPQRLAARWGLLTGGFAVSQAIAGYMLSGLYGWTHSYFSLFPISAAALVLAAVLASQAAHRVAISSRRNPR